MNSADNRMPSSTVLIISAAFAVVFLILFMWVGGFGFFGAFFLGLLVGIVVFVILTMMFASDGAGSSGSGTAAAAPDAPKQTAGEAAKKDVAGADPRSGGAASVAATASDGAPADATKPGSGAAKGAGAGDPKPGAAGASSAEAKPKAKTAKPGASQGAGAGGGIADYDKDGVLEGTDEGTKPDTLPGPREGGADNLKEIKGVGPALEKMLNSMGVYHFDQVAGWTADEVAWVDANLGRFRGRVSRDGWIEQAKILAAGGETEFSKKVDKGGVY